jgi:hypothetical protein
VLGDVDGETVSALIQRAEGNAFHLEELIRQVAQHRGDALPDTVLGMVQARLDALGNSLARVLRAGSVFGDRFPKDGVAALLGRDGASRSLESWLAQLVEQEVIEAAGPGYAFRHDLMREGAYAMLVDEERKAAHRLAAEWLEASGSGTATELAEHYRRAGDAPRAAHFAARSAAEALEAHDFRAACERATDAIALGAEGRDRGAALLALADALGWLGQMGESIARAKEAKAALQPGSWSWMRAQLALVSAASRTGDWASLNEAVDELVGASVPESLESRHVEVLGNALVICARMSGTLGQLMALSQRVLSYSDRADSLDARARSRLESTRGIVLSRMDQLEASVAALRAALAFAEQAGDARQLTFTRMSLAKEIGALGQTSEAIELLERSRADGERIGVRTIVAIARFGLAMLALHEGALERASAHAEEALALVGAGDSIHEAALVVSSLARLAAGELDAAERSAARLLESVQGAGRSRRYAFALFARVLAARGDGDGALERARAALAERSPESDLVLDAELAPLALAEALVARGEREEARAALAASMARIGERAEKIADPAARKSFLTVIRTHREISALARALN